jgi:hypothetical protein
VCTDVRISSGGAKACWLAPSGEAARRPAIVRTHLRRGQRCAETTAPVFARAQAPTRRLGSNEKPATIRPRSPSCHAAAAGSCVKIPSSSSVQPTTVLTKRAAGMSVATKLAIAIMTPKIAVSSSAERAGKRQNADTTNQAPSAAFVYRAQRPSPSLKCARSCVAGDSPHAPVSVTLGLCALNLARLPAFTHRSTSPIITMTHCTSNQFWFGRVRSKRPSTGA